MQVTDGPAYIDGICVPTITEMQIALRKVAKLFDFGVDLDYRYSLQLNKSKSYDNIRGNINTELRRKLVFIETIKTWSNLLLLWTLGYVLLK